MRALERLTNTVALGTGISALALALFFCPDAALAGEWELRLPVQKTARMTLPEQPAPATTDSGPAAADKRASAPEAPKTALGRAAEAAAAAEKAAGKPARTPEAKPAPVKPAPAQPAPAVTGPDAAPTAAPHRASAQKTAGAKAQTPQDDSRKSEATKAAAADSAAKAAAAKAALAAAPAVDPKALAMPQPRPQGTPLPLPPDGKWVGDIVLEFQPDRVIVHADTNAAVERVTWFNLAAPDAPRKLAVDLRGPWRKKGGTLLRYDTGPVKTVVVGEHQDRLRLSIEFRNGAVSREFAPELVKEAESLRVSIPLAVRLGS